MGNGDGTFTPTYDIFPFLGGYPVYAASDLDGNGISRRMVELDNGTSSFCMYYVPLRWTEAPTPCRLLSRSRL